MPAARPDYPILLFDDQQAWEAWLDANHGTAPGVWLRLAKKASALSSVSYAEALDVALCYGWIDGQVKKLDDDSYVQKFTPRGRRSLWSKINRDKVARLVEAGRMRPAGQAAVDAAKADGRWDRAYDSASQATVPDDLAQALARTPKAKRFFEALDRTNRYAVIWRVQTAAKPETRARRIAQLVEMLARGEKLH
jgi:uncharacterized protein YdeI (YjbR/CyaY-like superfamily)